MFDHSEFVPSILAPDVVTRGSVVGWIAPDVWSVAVSRPVDSADAARPTPVRDSDFDILCW